MQPEIYGLDECFVSSVQKHGYGDQTTVCRVIDECAKASFAACGDAFDPATDLLEVLPTESGYDKHPEFLAGLPVWAKVEAGKAAARQGLGANVMGEFGVTASGRVDIWLTDNQLIVQVAAANDTEDVTHLAADRLNKNTGTGYAESHIESSGVITAEETDWTECQLFAKLQSGMCVREMVRASSTAHGTVYIIVDVVGTPDFDPVYSKVAEDMLNSMTRTG